MPCQGQPLLLLLLPLRQPRLLRPLLLLPLLLLQRLMLKRRWEGCQAVCAPLASA
jgi:hypothetical protein